MANPRLDPRCFEALDAPDAEDVTCTKSVGAAAQAALDLKVLAIDLRLLAGDLLRMSERLKGAATG